MSRTPEYTVGERIAIQFSNDRWYLGTVQGEEKNGASIVCFDDGDRDSFDLTLDSGVRVKAAPMDETLNDREIRIFWKREDRWYHGRIRHYDPRVGKHQIRYDDGDVKWTRLRGRKYQITSGPTSLASKSSSYDEERKGNVSYESDDEGRHGRRGQLIQRSNSMLGRDARRIFRNVIEDTETGDIVGHRVRVRMHGRWKEAIVTDQRADKYLLEFDDGDVRWKRPRSGEIELIATVRLKTSTDHRREGGRYHDSDSDYDDDDDYEDNPSYVPVGERVESKFNDGWYRGVVVAYARGPPPRGSVHIEYDDGETRWENLDTLRWRRVRNERSGSLLNRGSSLQRIRRRMETAGTWDDDRGF